MKIKELIDLLLKYDGELEVVLDDYENPRGGELDIGGLVFMDNKVTIINDWGHSV